MIGFKMGIKPPKNAGYSVKTYLNVDKITRNGSAMEGPLEVMLQAYMRTRWGRKVDVFSVRSTSHDRELDVRAMQVAAQVMYMWMESQAVPADLPLGWRWRSYVREAKGSREIVWEARCGLSAVHQKVVDADGDGVQETLQVWMASVLERVETDVQL